MHTVLEIFSAFFDVVFIEAQQLTKADQSSFRLRRDHAALGECHVEQGKRPLSWLATLST
jgi:hypothetical protein